jgi:hypothetical protein
MTTPTTFATLKTALDEWTHRDDTAYTAMREAFIAFAEARMYDDLILREMESDETMTLTQGQNYVAIPAGFISPITFWLIVDSERVELERVLPEQLPYYTDATQPEFYAIDGANIRFDCPAGSAYSARFRMVKKSNLSDSNTTNALLTKRPDVYVAACMSEYARWAQDSEVFNAWEPKYIKGRDALKAAEARSRQVTLRTDIPTRGRSNIIRGE